MYDLVTHIDNTMYQKYAVPMPNACKQDILNDLTAVSSYVSLYVYTHLKSDQIMHITMFINIMAGIYSIYRHTDIQVHQNV